jgi:PPOX class probable F420-dependent enzyme
MAKPIPDSFVDLFASRALAHLATLMPDGRPQVTPVWVDYDGEHVLINTAAGRQKDRNLVRDGRVALSIVDPANADRYLEVRGHVAARTEVGAEAHIDQLSRRYVGTDFPWRRPGEVRVIFRIAPESFTSMA